MSRKVHICVSVIYYIDMADKTAIDLKQLTYEIRHMTPRQKLYKLLKKELLKLDHWKNITHKQSTP